MKKTNLNRRTLRARSACGGTLAMMAATLLATGCMQEMPNEEPEQAGNAPKVMAELAEEPVTRASAGAEGRAAEAVEAFEMPLTRTTIDAAEADNDGTLAVLWMPEDQIGVFSTGSGNVLYVNDEQTENVPNASFSSTADITGEIQYAYYPYAETNNGNAVENLTGTLPAEQVMSDRITGDYKYGELKARTAEGGYKFRFHNLFSLVRFNIDATGTTLAGQTLESVTLTVTRNGAAVPVTGEFTFDATDGSYELGTTSNELKTVWNKELGGTYSSFASVFPEIKSGDKLTFAFRTSGYTTTFSVTSKVDFEPEMYYTFPLKLSVFASSADKYGYATKARPTITDFKLEVSKNTGKLLDNKTVWSSSWISRGPKFENVTTHSATYDGNNINVMIPYLYDFKLVPTFTVASGATVTVDGKTVTSGSTEVDFTGGATMTVSTADDYRDYKVTLSNTGLPVVVIEHDREAGDFSEVKKSGLFGKTLNKFVDFYIRGKDTDWVETDKISVYYPDGTVDVDHAACGVRLRGNTTQEYPKKPFAIKLKSGASVLGMPSHKRWVLLANWLDHSMIRNTVAFDIAHAIESAVKNNNLAQGIPWNVHGYNVELVVDGHYVGNYYLCEQIKIDGNRLNIKKPYDAEDNPAAFADCGYLLEFDMKEDTDIKYTTSNGAWVKFKNDEPESSDVYKAVSQKIQRIEDNLDNGKYAEAYTELDINSVVDQFLIWELTMNREYGDPGSVYMFMDGNGKLSAGPVWDFDRGTFQNQEEAKSLGNTDSYRVKSDDAWMFNRSQESETYSYIWYRQLAKDTEFQNVVKTRWAVIYPSLKAVVNTIETYREPMRASFEYDSAMWPTSKSDVQAYNSDFKDWSGDETISDWDELVDNFKTVYKERLDGMNYLITNGIF